MIHLNEILAIVIKSIADEANVETTKITEDTDLVEELQLEKKQLENIFSALAEEFEEPGLQYDPGKTPVVTVGDIVLYVARRLRDDS
jgi:hypothetical protein